MRLTLLGTGSSDGWPNPWCDCASCTWARGREVRGHTSVLVDGVLLIDFGPDVPRSAARHGVSLAGVRHLLLGHAHPDHTGPAALHWRRFSTVADVPLEVVAPPAAIAVCRESLAGHPDPVTYVTATAGDVLDVGGFVVRPLAARHFDAEAGPAVLFDVTTPDGGRLLYAADTGAPLPSATTAACAGRAYDVVLLEETNGDRPGSDQHLGLDAFAVVCAGLRACGAVVASTRVIAVHLGHGNPPGDELRRRLAPAEVHPDGTVIDVGGPPSDVPHGPRRVLVTGGARSGKSAEAERHLLGVPEVAYVATAGPVPPGDDEWTARVDAHRLRRPSTWTTVETTDVAGLLRTDGPPMLVDSLGMWMAAHLDDPDPDLAGRVDDLVAAWRATRRTVVAVTDEAGSGVVPSTSAGRRFRDWLGRLNAAIAAESDEVLLVTAGLTQRLR